ncbi:hypothetical protein SAMD00019534_016540 [Acytostelium subglobosum LB1]|uniref:hypothetical protein n=1 Tax=Acytostelium subglobosum LB1 TaxID=1410327 RepID=UPI00064486CA|nr:hypothetical protein SAMD00019534_016540 [Acytostelium subglobosum LB1]GAM18479.1 hypothetical protein SAMD00019534_016540 [Acytostelium subglobosum LB1]|eukprot:XP_012757699.1 hypothetical protein SAMD00019534_016540 [Acytostelium subglobosum LB1]
MHGQGTYLENYLESISTVPLELTRNLALIKELDYRSNDVVDRVETLTTQLLSNTTASRKAALDFLSEKGTKQYKSDMKTVMEYADEKVELSNQLYELIDRHIRKLDNDLKKFEAEIEEEDEKKKQRKGAPQPVEAPRKGKANVPAPNSQHVSLFGRKKSISESTVSTQDTKMASITGSGSTADLDLAIDPNEPTYCVCGRVSFGEMIECENSGCKIEWFHFECVGLSNPPKGKWYCPDCVKKKNIK